jgi:WD40 repeat protein
MIVTFYSFKGGVGRSMALVNVAEILADRGYRVIVCDWDLEAPGLERYLTSREVDGVPWESVLEQLIKAPGLIDLLTEYRDSLSSSTPRPASEEDYARLGDVLVRRPSTIAVPVSMQAGTSPTPHVRSGWVKLLSAGRRDGAFQQTYAEVVRSFDWEEFYNRWAGGSYVEFMRRDLVGNAETTGAADILLIDSRTGVTEQGGICTHHLADLVVLMSAANDANLAGIEWMAEGLSDERLAVLRNNRPLQVLPVAARIEQGSQKEELVDFRRRFTERFRRYAARASGVSVAPEEFEIYTEIPYMAFYSFTERVVAREPEERREQNLYTKYGNLTDTIVANGVARGLLPERGVGAARLLGGKRISSARRRRPTVYLSVAERESPLGRTIAVGLADAGLDVITRTDGRPDRWRRSLRFVILSEGAESPAQKAEIAEMRRQAALRPEVRIITLLADDQPRRNAPDLTPFIMPQGIEEDDAGFFEALADEITSNDPRPSQAPGMTLPGARPMTEEDAAIFFGRDAELTQAARWPEAGCWLDVKGDSGMGKTSFVQAGLLPMIRRGEVPGIAEDVAVTVMQMGAVLPPIIPAGLVIFEDCERLAAADPEELRKWWRQVVPRPSPRDFFLVTVGRSGSPLESLPDLGAPPVSIPLSGLRPEEARQALAGPATLAGVTWESGLPQRIVCDLADAGGSGLSHKSDAVVDPSLLALVSAQLVDGKTAQITHERYDQGGCIGDRLAELAAKALQEIEEPGRTRARSLLARLVSSEGEPRSLTVEEALEVLGDKDGDQLLESLAERRLVRVGAHVELRHPLLARWWPALRQWAAIEGERIAPAEALKSAVALWEATGQATTALPRGRALDFMSKAARHDPEAQTFVKRARRTQNVRLGVFVALVIAVLGLGFSTRTFLLERERRIAAQGKADRLAKVSLAAADPTQALVLAIAAGEAAETPLSREALVKAVPRARLRAVLKHDAPVVAAALSPDGKSLLSVTTVAIAKWDTGSGAKLASQGTGSLDVGSTIIAADISRDLMSVAALNESRRLTWVTSGRFGTQQHMPPFGYTDSFALSPSGRELAVGTFGGLIILRAPGHYGASLKADGLLEAVAFTRDGETVVGSSDKGALNIWTRLHDPVLKPIRDYARANTGSSWAISAGGNRILTSHNNGASMWIVDPSRTPALSRAPWSLIHNGYLRVGKDSFGNNDQNVALIYGDAIHVWPAGVPSGGIVIKPPLGRISLCAFDPNRPQFLAANPSGRIAVCRLNASGSALIDTLLLTGHKDWITRAFFSSDGSTVISASRDGTVRLWWTNDVVVPQEFRELLEAARQHLPVTMTDADRNGILSQTGETP